MPWTLTTPLNTGDLDSGTYGEVKITRMMFDPNRKMIQARLEYGNTVDGEWVGGYVPQGKYSNVNIQDEVGGTPHFTNLVGGHTSNNAELTYDAVKRGLYEWLSTNGYLDPGSVT